MDGRPNLRLCNVILDVQITPFGPKSLYAFEFTLSTPLIYLSGLRNGFYTKALEFWWILELDSPNAWGIFCNFFLQQIFIKIPFLACKSLKKSGFHSKTLEHNKLATFAQLLHVRTRVKIQLLFKLYFGKLNIILS